MNFIPNGTVGQHLHHEPFFPAFGVFGQRAIDKAVAVSIVAALQYSAGIDPPEAADTDHHGDDVTGCLRRLKRMHDSPGGKHFPGVQIRTGLLINRRPTAQANAVFIHDKPCCWWIFDVALVLVTQGFFLPGIDKRCHLKSRGRLQGNHRFILDGDCGETTGEMDSLFAEA